MLLIVAYVVLVLIVSVSRPLVGLVLASNAFLIGSLAGPSDEGTGMAGVIIPGAAMGAIVLRSWLAGKLARYVPATTDLLILALFAIHLASAAYSREPAVSLEYSMRLLFLGLSFYFATRLSFDIYRDKNAAIQDFLIGCFAAGCLFAVLALLFGTSNWEEVTRIAIGSTAIPLAMTLGLGIIGGLFLLLAFPMGRVSRVSLYVGLLTIGYSLLLTNTRSVLLALLIAVLAILFMYKPVSIVRGSTSAVVTAIVAMLLGLAVVVSANYQLVSRGFGGLGNIVSGQFGTSDLARIYSWRLALDDLLANPLLGKSAGVFEASVGAYPHNIVLEVGAATGIPGLLLLAALMLSPVVACVQTHSPHGRLMLPAFIFTCFIAQLSLSLWMQKMLFICVGMVIAASTSSRTSGYPLAHDNSSQPSRQAHSAR